MLGVDGRKKDETLLALKTMVGSLNVGLAVTDCSLNAGCVIRVHCVAFSAYLALDNLAFGKRHNVSDAISNILLDACVGSVDLVAGGALLACGSVGEDAVGEAGLSCCALNVVCRQGCCRCKNVTRFADGALDIV